MSYHDIHVSEVEELLKTPGLTIIDMRDEVSRSRGMLPSALHHSDEVIGALLKRRRTQPSVLVYCYHGNASRELCSLLGQLGLDRVHNLEGGWQAWDLWQQNI